MEVCCRRSSNWAMRSAMLAMVAMSSEGLGRDSSDIIFQKLAGSVPVSREKMIEFIDSS